MHPPASSSWYTHTQSQILIIGGCISESQPLPCSLLHESGGILVKNAGGRELKGIKQILCKTKRRADGKWKKDIIMEEFLNLLPYNLENDRPRPPSRGQASRNPTRNTWKRTYKRKNSWSHCQNNEFNLYKEGTKATNKKIVETFPRESLKSWSFTLLLNLWLLRKKTRDASF